MKKYLLSVIIVLCVSLISSMLVFAAAKATKSKSKGVTIEASGTALWDYLQKSAYTKKWKMWPGKKALYKGEEPHGALLTTYVNSISLRAITGKKGTLPAGSIVVKENYMPDKKLAAITVMYKVKGYNPEAGDWFWAKYSPDGKIEAEGKADMCIKCHSENKDNDFIYTSALK